MALLLFGTVMSRAQQEFSTLVVDFTDGTSVSISLHDRPALYIDRKDGNEILSVWYVGGESGSVNTQYDNSKVRKFYFRMYDPAIADHVSSMDKEDEVGIVFVDNWTVHVSGLKQADEVRVYSIDGRQILTGTKTDDGRCDVQLGGCPKGTYIIRINDKHSFKVQKR